MSNQAVKITMILVSVLALGIGGYVWWDRTQNQYRSDTITQEVPGIGHLLLPDLDNAVVTVIDRPHYPEENMDEERKKEIKRLRVFNVSTNSIGLRGPELEDPKPEIRIACVGDSVAFGWGVSYEESYPARLERLLIERGRSVEVLNAGVPAMKPGTIWKWAIDQFSVWNPDLILVARRPDYSGQKSEDQAIEELVNAVRAIAVPAADKGVRVALILPPVSTFDVRGSQVYQREEQLLTAALVPQGGPVVDLTEAFRSEAKALNTGVRLQVQGGVQKMFQARAISC